MIRDKIICRGLKYSCSIGFHREEQGLRQELLIDFEAAVPAMSPEHRDDQRYVTLDYFEADRAILAVLEGCHFDLIETVAEVVAAALLERFPKVASVTVTVAKKPLGMPRLGQVNYVCERTR